MGQIFILFFFYFTVLFSILGYGKLITLFNSNNQDNEFDGINGIAFLIVLSYITNFFTAHNYLHNSIIILFGLLIFIYDLRKNFDKKFKQNLLIFFVFSVLFIGILMHKNHDDFFYYHFPYTLILTNFEKIFGLGQLNHGFRTPSSIFYLNSLFYLPGIKYFLMNSGAIYILGFSNLIFINIIKKNLFRKKYNFILFLSLLSFIYVNTAFYRIAEHGTDRSALILIFVMAIYYLKSVNFLDNYNNPNLLNLYFSKLIILFFIIISLKNFYLIYFFILLIWIFEMKKFLFHKSFLKTVFKNSSIYIFIVGIFLSIFTIFSNTGCLVYPASFTCFEQFSWSIPTDSVDQMKVWYEQWSKAGATPNFRVENPEIYISKLNWLNNWIKIYFFTKVTDNILVLITICTIGFLVFTYKSKKIKLHKRKYILFYFSILILFLEWFYNHPALRYGGYTILALMVFIPISLFLEKFQSNSILFKKKVYFLITLTALIFISKNLNRINHEYIKYNYNLIKNPFFYLNKDGFKINDMVKIYYEKQKENSKKKYLILNQKILN
tara:strand:- start:36 stop:1688 length:1653 start_codon:yes stop_codon:yes gene_type:complete